MPSTPAFYSLDEANKPASNRVYHNNGACSSGRNIPYVDRRKGNGNYRLCSDCDRLNRLGR